jgi:Zn-dependent alcohol dehydrogenase
VGPGLWCREVFAFDTDRKKLDIAKETGARDVFSVEDEGYLSVFMSSQKAPA